MRKLRKRERYALFLSGLLHLLFLTNVSLAQQTSTKKTLTGGSSDTTANIKTLQIGDTIPEELWNLPLQVVHASGQEGTLRLGDYRHKKLIILDFWATWCAPCIRSLHKLDTIYNRSSADLMVIASSDEQQDKVGTLWKQKGFAFPSVYRDTLLRRLFDFRIIPHQVWLRDGKVMAFTGASSLSEDLIAEALQGAPIYMLMKLDTVKFDASRPFVQLTNGLRHSDALYMSTLTKALDMRIGGMGITDTSILIYNSPLRALLSMAFMDEIPTSGRHNRVEVEVGPNLHDLFYPPDRAGLSRYEGELMYQQWLKDTRFCYNLLVHVPTSRAAMLSIFKKDILQFFELHYGVTAYIENREKECWVLTARSSKKPKTGNNGIRLGDLHQRLAFAHRKLAEPIALQASADILLDMDMPADLGDLEAVREQLQIQGIGMQKKKTVLPVLIITNK